MKKMLSFFKNKKILSIILGSVAVITIIVVAVNLNKKENIDNKPEMCVVQFEANGGTTVAQQEIECGSVIVQPDNPQKEGFVFKYWEYNGEEYNFSNPIDKDITLEAKWEKNIENNKPNTGNNNSTSNENSNTNSNENKEDTKLDVFHEYDDLVKLYSGRWYLSGYEDVCIDVSKYEYAEGMYIETHNFSLSINDENLNLLEGVHIIYPDKNQNISGFSCGTVILYQDWKDRLFEEKIVLGKDCIYIDNHKFVKEKGTKDRYYDTCYREALGTWYLQNLPNSSIEIFSNSDGNIDNSDTFIIKTTLFNLNTFSTNLITNNAGSGRADRKSDWEKYGISVSNGVLTITNKNGTRTFYKKKTYVKVESITLDESKLELFISDTKKLNMTILPTDAYNKTVTWSSSDASIATVSSDGTVTAKKKGVVTITATTKDGNKTATCIVSVKNVNVTGITLNKTTLNLVRNQTGNLSATILPTNATNKNYTWSSSDTSIATVSSNGVVTAKKKGVATITVTTEDGSKTASCTVEVSNPKLTADTSIGLSYIAGLTGTSRGIKVTITASGGSGLYNYYNIKLYKDGVLIGSSTNTNSNTLFVEGHSNGSYYAEIEVHDTEGNVFNATSSVSTISGF